MCEIDNESLEMLISGQWGALTRTMQIELFRAYLHEKKEKERLRDCIDAYLPGAFKLVEAREEVINEMHIDCDDASIQYGFIDADRVQLDAFNLITHRIN